MLVILRKIIYLQNKHIHVNNRISYLQLLLSYLQILLSNQEKTTTLEWLFPLVLAQVCFNLRIFLKNQLFGCRQLLLLQS